ncbi:MAG TPA: hypothetical protein VJ165_05055, partial [candidate division Zixibacteria bacterium]|nr:hypothetical protein [candidate division Zixibacteria bacterium]
MKAPNLLTKKFFLIYSILFFGVFHMAESVVTKEQLYRKIGEFEGLEAGVRVEVCKISVYEQIGPNITEDEQFVKLYMPDWQGEKYKVKVFKWVDTSFVFEGRYYTNNDTGVGLEYGEYDTSGTRDLKLPDKYSNSTEISNLLKGSMVKAFAEGDLNSDGRLDLVLVYGDSTASTKRYILDEDPKSDYHLVIFEKADKNKYVKRFTHDVFSKLTLVGKVEIRDVNNDRIPDVILWTFWFGGSASGETAEFFSRK